MSLKKVYSHIVNTNLTINNFSGTQKQCAYVKYNLENEKLNNFKMCVVMYVTFYICPWANFVGLRKTS